MKKLIFKLLLVLLLIGIFIVSKHFPFFRYAIANADEVKVTLISVKGDVKLKVKEELKKVSKGDVVPLNSTLECGIGSEAILKWENGNVIKVKELTVFKVKSSSADEIGKEHYEMDITKGKIIAKVKTLVTKDSIFIIRTPNAVAGVRGTEFFTEVTPENKSIFSVLKGSVFVESAGIETIIPENHQVEVAEGLPPSQPEPLQSEIKEEMEKEIKEMEETIEEESEGKEEWEEKEEEESKEEKVSEEQEPTAIEPTPEDNVSNIVEDIINTEINEVLQSDIINFSPGTGGMDIIIQIPEEK